jgi:hypothetical protein
MNGTAANVLITTCFLLVFPLDFRNFSFLSNMNFQALEIKIAAYGEESQHVCITLSGIADSYLKLKQFDKALEYAT